MQTHRGNNRYAPVYTWFVLLLLDQHRTEFMDGRTMKMKELALHKEHEVPEGRQRAAEALAASSMNLYSALGKSELHGDMTTGRAKEIIVRVLLDGEKTMLDLAEAFDACYRQHYDRSPART